MRRLSGLICGATALALAACSSSSGGDTAASGGERLRVVTTVAPITSIVANVAGEAADVTGLVPEGTDSHTYEPPPSTAKALSEADVIFLNGLALEEPIEELAESSKKPGGEIVLLGDAAVAPQQYLYDFSFPKEGGRPNPHVWTNPPMARRMAEAAAAALARRDPAHAATFRANLARFVARVDELDRAVASATATVAPEGRKLLTYHDAYAYFARQYGWEVVGAVQPSDFDEPSPGEVAGLIEQIRATGVPAIFGSEVFPSPVLQQIGRETGVRYVDALRDDDLPGRPGDSEHSYVGLMRFNVVTMVQALGGDASVLSDLPAVDPVFNQARYPQ